LKKTYGACHATPSNEQPYAFRAAYEGLFGTQKPPSPTTLKSSRRPLHDEVAHVLKFLSI